MSKLKVGELINKRYFEKGDRFFYEVFNQKIYEPVKKLGKLGTVIDLGACTGEFSFWVYDQAERIYAIEPMKQYYKEMCGIIKEFNLNKIKPFNIAIGKKNTTGYMDEVENKGANKLLDDQVTKNPVEVKTLATFMNENNIGEVDVLKVDIENGELAVFGSLDFHQVADRIKFFYEGGEVE